MKKIIISLLILSMISLVNASISCDSFSYSNTYDEGDVPSTILVTTNCLNSDPNNSVTFNSLGSFFTISGENTIGPGSSKGQININTNDVPVGENIGYISFSSGENIKINLTVEDGVQTTGCRLIELPHTTNFRIKQGETSASGEIKVKASSECPDLDFNVIAQTQMSKPMYIQSKGESSPGKEYTFILGLDATDVSTGTYSNSYTVSASAGDEVYQKTIQLSTTVTLGDSPISNTSFSTMPSCNLETNMVLNQTYTLSCQLSDPNIKIAVPYNDFFKGVDTETIGSTFEYILEPLKTGNTNFLATFNYEGLSIGIPFSKEVRVTASPTATSGTEIEALFYQSGEKVDIDNLITGEVTILARDTKTQNVLNSYSIYLNGNSVNSTFNLESEKEYELIIDATNYMSRTLNFTVSEGELIIELIPNKTTYSTGDVVNLTSNINNTKFLLNDNLIESPYTFSSSGNIVLKAIREGYKTYEQNISIVSSLRYLSVTPQIADWKKGDEVKMPLTENASWSVYLDNEEIKSGNGDLVTFELKDSGTYQVRANGNVILPGGVLENKSWFDYLKFWNHGFLGWAIFILIIGGIGFFGYRRLFNEEQDIYSDRMPDRGG